MKLFIYIRLFFSVLLCVLALFPPVSARQTELNNTNCNKIETFVDKNALIERIFLRNFKITYSEICPYTDENNYPLEEHCWNKAYGCNETGENACAKKLGRLLAEIVIENQTNDVRLRRAIKAVKVTFETFSNAKYYPACAVTYNNFIISLNTRRNELKGALKTIITNKDLDIIEYDLNTPFVSTINIVNNFAKNFDLLLKEKDNIQYTTYKPVEAVSKTNFSKPAPASTVISSLSTSKSDIVYVNRQSNDSIKKLKIIYFIQVVLILAFLFLFWRYINLTKHFKILQKNGVARLFERIARAFERINTNEKNYKQLIDAVEKDKIKQSKEIDERIKTIEEWINANKAIK